MILVDTSVWVDHFRVKNERLSDLLADGKVLGHRFVLGELALGNLRQRDVVFRALRRLPQATAGRDPEILEMINRERLFGTGIGYVDAHLLAAVRLTPGASLWTNDRRLRAIAASLGLAAMLLH